MKLRGKANPNLSYFLTWMPTSLKGMSQKHTTSGAYISLRLRSAALLTVRFPLIAGLWGG